MLISTPVTQLLRIDHPILLAPMDIVADGRLVAAVDAAGGFGILGGGYGEEKWLVRELDVLERAKARFGVGFITWSMAKQPRLLDLALERRPAAVMLSFGIPGPFVDRIKREGAMVICQVQSAELAKDADEAEAAKERIRDVTGDDTLRSIVFDISRRHVWPAPFTARCLRNAHADR